MNSVHKSFSCRFATGHFPYMKPFAVDEAWKTLTSIFIGNKYAVFMANTTPQLSRYIMAGMCPHDSGQFYDRPFGIVGIVNACDAWTRTHFAHDMHITKCGVKIHIFTSDTCSFSICFAHLSTGVFARVGFNDERHESRRGFRGSDSRSNAFRSRMLAGVSQSTRAIIPAD